MSVLRVIKNGPRYYSSFVEDKQHIYSFVRDEPLRNCANFIKDYKRYYKKYPPAETSSRKLSTLPDYENYIHVEMEDIYILQRRCLMYNVGLLEVGKFEYMFKKGIFDVSISVNSILPEIDIDERKNLLNYALLLNDDHSE